ncbi:CGGC domain protein [Neomoorella glycerini]|uniref:CGGC domain protein n=1 Tax=Neomoorella glycerini TaxID=55779 RepID=A0A6I5ZR31_9FIRM|nr:CGGC domain-containing protein [Moorella glycerini]QGP92119.1 CGGC domain protein [Moorella glycerini]
MHRVGIIACRDHWKKGCPGYQAHILCFLALEKKRGPLGELPGAKIVAMQPCPGCPGTGRLDVARRLVRQEGVDYFVFPSCTFFDNHCPTAFAQAAAIEAELGRPVLMGSYLEAAAARCCSTVSLNPGDIPSLTECRQRLLNLNYLRYLYEKQAATPRKALQILTLLKAT